MKYYILLFLIILFSCENEPPVLSDPIVNVLVYEKGSSKVSKDSVFLSIHLQIFDENGFDDIRFLRFIHLETDYNWIVDKELIEKTIWSNKTYYGFSFLEYNNASQILTGDYIIEVEDSNGNITTQLVTVDDNILSENVLDNPYSIDVYESDSEEKIQDKQIKIMGDDFISFEVKFINNPSFYNYSRKKFTDKDYVTLFKNQEENLNNIISVIVRKNDTLVYFLKEINL